MTDSIPRADFYLIPALLFVNVMVGAGVAGFITTLRWEADVKLHKAVIQTERQAHQETAEALLRVADKRESCEAQLQDLKAPKREDLFPPPPIDKLLRDMECVALQAAWIGRTEAELGSPAGLLRRSLVDRDIEALRELTKGQQRLFLAKLKDFPRCMNSD